MRTLIICGALTCGALASTPANAQEQTPKQAPSEKQPVNAMCPIGKEPIIPSAGTVEYKGNTIGLCCPSCGKAFLAWNDERKDEFVVLAAAGREQGQAASEGADKRQPPAADDATVIRDQLMHYPIDTCLVAGAKLGSMGEPINFVHEGRLVRFCCAGCQPKFEASPDQYLSKLDEAIVEQQRDAYPLDTCVVMGAALGSMGDPVEHIHANRLYRFCCEGCIDAFNENPDEFITVIDKAYADAQRDEYPLETCVVSGAKLGSMGEPVEVVAGTRLVRFCCAGCTPKFRAAPQPFLSMLSTE